MTLIAFVLVLLTVAYHQVTTLVDLYPFNNIRDSKRSQRFAEAAINGPIMLVPAVALLLGGLWHVWGLGLFAGIFELVVAIGGVANWWLPYLVGGKTPWATAGSGTTWSELHDRTYSHTIIVLPRIGNRPRPNLEHMILHGLMIAAAVLCVVAAPGL
jgi:hypothetical protein